MAGGFTVTPQALVSLARRLQDAGESLAGIESQVRGLGDGDLGHRAVEKGVAEFADAWAAQATDLATQLRETGEQLVRAADNYQTVEDAQRRIQGGP